MSATNKADFEASVQLEDRRVPLHIPVAWAAGKLRKMSDLEIRDALKDLHHERARRDTEAQRRRDTALFDVAQRALADALGFTRHDTLKDEA
jgi:hypothetical protein